MSKMRVGKKASIIMVVFNWLCSFSSYISFSLGFGKSVSTDGVTESLYDMEIRTLSPVSLVKCNNLLEQIAPYYRYHGINIESCYEDFDQHNIGLVTESQVQYFELTDIWCVQATANCFNGTVSTCTFSES